MHALSTSSGYCNTQMTADMLQVSLLLGFTDALFAGRGRRMGSSGAGGWLYQPQIDRMQLPDHLTSWFPGGSSNCVQIHSLVEEASNSSDNSAYPSCTEMSILRPKTFRWKLQEESNEFVSSLILVASGITNWGLRSVRNVTKSGYQLITILVPAWDRISFDRYNPEIFNVTNTFDVEKYRDNRNTL